MDWRETFQATIDCYPNDLEAGAEACERLLSVPGLMPREFELAARRNATWFLPKLADLVSGDAAEITFPVPDGWSRFNPSIAAGPEGELLCIVRSSNYTVGPDMIYHYPEESGGVIDTTNYVVRVNPDLSTEGATPIRDAHLRISPPPFPVTGFEDCRLFWHDGWRFSATVRDRDERGVCQMVMAGLASDGGEWMAGGLTVLSGQRRHEKNWMPLAAPRSDRQQLVYSCDPMLLLVADRKGALPNLWRRSPFIAREFRGGTQLLWIASPHVPSSGYLALVHEAVNFPDPPRRIYQHRVVWWNANLDIERVSRPFCFHHRGLEFAAGMVRVGDDLIISYGIGDKEAWLTKVPLDRVLGLLREPLPEE